MEERHKILQNSEHKEICSKVLKQGGAARYVWWYFYLVRNFPNCTTEILGQVYYYVNIAITIISYINLVKI